MEADVFHSGVDHLISEDIETTTTSARDDWVAKWIEILELKKKREGKRSYLQIAVDNGLVVFSTLLLIICLNRILGITMLILVALIVLTIIAVLLYFLDK